MRDFSPSISLVSKQVRSVATTTVPIHGCNTPAGRRACVVWPLCPYVPRLPDTYHGPNDMVSVSIARDHGRLSWGGPVSLSASRPDVVLLRLCLITFRDLFLRVEPGPRRGTPHVSFRMVGPTIPAPGKRELAWLSSRAVSVSPAESQVARKHGPPSSRQARRATRQAQANSSVELVLGSWFGGAPLLPLPLTFPGRG